MTKPLRVLFSMRNFWYVKLFDSVVRELASRGHHVHVLAERGAHNERSQDWNAAAAALAAEYPTITFGWAPRQLDDDWVDLRVMIRLGLDHLRFLEPEYADAPMLGLRARRRTPEAIVALADAPGFRTGPGRRLIGAALRTAERAIPADPELDACIAAHDADVVLVTPMLTLGSEQVDVVRIARRLGVPSVLCVGSWDHLSSKALVREWPDRLLVWNETQRREATAFHGIPADRVVVTGAQCFDQWFDRQPALDRGAFCRRVGLDPSRPYVLYVCSALFEGSPSEAEFVRRWIDAVRACGDAALRDAGILVRPHPKRAYEWEQVSLAGLENVSLWPPDAAAPFDAATRDDYFDSMFHSAVIAGLNTSALIEGGIIGRRVHTILLPEFYDNQEGTLHFRYLLDGGLLQAARDLPTHVAQLASSVASHDPAVHHNQAFVETFVRPAGLGRASTPVFADAVERIAARRPRAVAESLWARGLRAALAPIARRTSGTFAEQIGRERRRVHKARARDERIAALQRQRAAEKARIVAERQTRRDAEAREREERRARARAGKVKAKEALLAARRREKETRQTEAHRRRRRNALNARLAGYLRRVTRPFSPSR
jgi:hypothetical protein